MNFHFGNERHSFCNRQVRSDHQYNDDQRAGRDEVMFYGNILNTRCLELATTHPLHSHTPHPQPRGAKDSTEFACGEPCVCGFPSIRVMQLPRSAGMRGQGARGSCPSALTPDRGGPWHTTPEMLRIFEVLSGPALKSTECGSENQNTKQPPPMGRPCSGAWGSQDQVELCGLSGSSLAGPKGLTFSPTRAPQSTMHTSHPQVPMHRDERIGTTDSTNALPRGCGCRTYTTAQGQRAGRQEVPTPVGAQSCREFHPHEEGLRGSLGAGGR